MAHAKLNFGMTNTQPVEKHLERLALEAGVLANVINVFRDIVPRVSFELKEKLAGLQKDPLDTRDIVSAIGRYDLVKRKTADVSFLTYAKTVVNKPEGLKGSFIDYLNTLTQLAPDVFKEANSILGEYNFVLSSFLSNKESKTALKDHSVLFLRIQKRREEMNKKLSSHFEHGDKSKGYLGQVVGRFADVETVLELTDRLVKARVDSNINDIKSAVTQAVGLLDLVVAQSEDKSIGNISGSAAKNIADGAYQLARYVEFVGIFRFHVEQMTVASKSLVETLDRIL